MSAIRIKAPNRILMILSSGEKETRVSPSRLPVLSFAHYFQGPDTQARENPLIVGLPPLDSRLQVSKPEGPTASLSMPGRKTFYSLSEDNNSKSEKYWAGLFFPRMLFPIHDLISLRMASWMWLQILSKSFQHGGRNGCNAFSQSEKHREERRTGSQSPQDQSRWGDNRYFWLEGKLHSNFALKSFKSLSCGCTWRHLLIENLDPFCN